MIPSILKKGDIIGVVAPSDYITEDNKKELLLAKKKVENDGFKVKFSKNLFSNSNGYSSAVEEKASDINEMFKDEKVKMIWCAKGGENSNSVFEYLDFDIIKSNPKIICGYSDITSITNIIYEKTGLVTFSGTNFKTIATDDTDFSYNQIKDRFLYGKTNLGKNIDYSIIKKGRKSAILIGGNLTLIRGLVCGKYSIDFNDKILFIEELGIETSPQKIVNHLYYMKQNGVFDKIKGLWIGNYTHDSNFKLENIILDVLGNDYNFPIIKSENFGHIEEKIVIPIGTKVLIDTNDTENIIKLREKCVN